MPVNRDSRITNITFYEKAYSNRNLFNILIKQCFSYDQLIKTKRNLQLSRKVPGFYGAMNILDYGFGHGTYLLRLPRGHQISGCELSNEARRNMGRLCLILHRKIDLYSPDEVIAGLPELLFDLVCCSHVIEHVDDEAGLLRLFHEALGAGGYLLLNVPLNEVWADPNHVRKYTAESTRKLLTSAGFQVEHVLQADRWSAWILHHEYVSEVRYKFIFRLVRLLFSLLPIYVLDILERILPQKYQYQQLLVLAKKI